MTLKEIQHFCRANGVPELVYKWSFSELDPGYLQKKLTPFLEEIDSFLNTRTSLIISFPGNTLLASRIAVTFLKASFISGYYLSRYTTPTNLVGYKIESWDDGEAYDELLNADLLILDKIIVTNPDKFPQKVFEEFIEDRILKNKSTLYVLHDKFESVFSEKIIDLFSQTEIKILTERNTKHVEK